MAAARKTEITQETLPAIISFSVDMRSQSCWPKGFSAALSEAVAGYIENFSAKQRVFEAASFLDLTVLKPSLAKLLVADDIPSLLKEYKRFLAIKVLVGDVTSPQRFFPSPLVDQLCHAHLQLLRHYLAACRALGEDMPIDHDPTTASDALKDKLRRVASTKVLYQVVFGEAPPEAFWSLSVGSMQIFVKTLTGSIITLSSCCSSTWRARPCVTRGSSWALGSSWRPAGPSPTTGWWTAPPSTTSAACAAASGWGDRAHRTSVKLAHELGKSTFSTGKPKLKQGEVPTFQAF